MPGADSNSFRLMNIRLKQSPRRWFKDTDSRLKQSNFNSISNEPCFHYR